MDLNFSLFDYFSPYVIKKTSYIYSLLKKLISYFISFLSIVLIFLLPGNHECCYTNAEHPTCGPGITL